MADPAEVVVKCCFCIRDLSKLTSISCAECTAVLCVKCFQYGAEAGKHKRGHNYEIHAEDNETLFNRQWGRDDEQNLIQTVHRYKLGNWDEVTAVISKGGLKRTTADVARHFQLYFVQSTLGRTAMKEKEWIERRDQFRDDVSKVISDPSGRELYYHAVIEALRSAKDLPNINDRDIVNQIDRLVSEHFASLIRNERKRKASEVSAALSKARQSIRKEAAFPYGESDDDAWWERMCRQPREKKELDRYYEEQSVCTEEKCMAEAVDTDNLTEITKMMKEAGLEDHEELGRELKALRLNITGEEKKDAHQEWGSPQKEVFAFKSRLERPETEAKRAKIVLPEQSDRPDLAVDMKREILMETVIDDEELVKQLEGQKFFEASMQMSDGKYQPAEQESSCDEAEVANGEEDEQEEDGDSSATDSDSDVSAGAYFDYDAYEAKMRAAGYQTDELYSDWDDESKAEISEKLKELVQSGVLVDSSEEADEDDEAMAGVAESSDDDAASAQEKASLDHCGLEQEAESAEEEDEEELEDEDDVQESAEGYSSDDDSVDESPSGTASSSEVASEFDSETEQLDTLFGAPAMRLPKEMRKEKKRPKRTVKFYELGSDDEYHTMDEDNAALPMVEMSIGASRKRAIARRLREDKERFYDVDPVTGRLVAKMPRPAMSADLEAEFRRYGQWEFARVKGESYAVLPRPPSSSAAPDAMLDNDRTPEARFGDDADAPLRARLSSTDRNDAFTADHPAFQKYLMEHFMDESDAGSACSSSDCESISSETGEQAITFLGYPMNGDSEEAYEDAEGAGDDREHFEDAKDEVMEHDGRQIGRHRGSESRALPQVKKEVVEKEIKEEEPDQAPPQEAMEPLRVDTRAIKAEPDDSDKESAEKNKQPEEVNDEDALISPEAEEEEEEDSEGLLYKLAEEGQEEDEENDVNDEEHGEKLDGEECEDDEEEGEEQSREAESDDDCVAEIEGLEQMCLCYGCTKNRWTATLGEREHALWEKIKQAGISFEEVKAKLKRHFVDEDSESCESTDSDEYFDDENEEPEEVYVDAVQINDTDWKLDLNSTPIPVRYGDDSEDSADVSEEELQALISHNIEEDTVHADMNVAQKMELVDESDRPASSTKATESTSAMLEDSLCGLEDEKEEQEDEDEEEEEEDDKDKTPPMLQGDEKKRGDDETESNADPAAEETPRSPILVIKKIQARGRTNLRVETRPRTPQEDKKVVEKSAHPQPPAKKKKISKEFEQLFKDLEIRKWEESQAKTLKERATKAMGTKREKSTRAGAQVAISDNSEAEQDPRPKKKNGGKKGSESDLFAIKPTCSKNILPELDDTPRGSRRSSISDLKKQSVSPKKKETKGTKRVAEPVESEKEESSGEEDEEETNGDGKSPQKKRRKHKRLIMSKKERKAKWDKKIQNRKAREEQKVEETKAVVSSIEFFEQHEVTFFSNVFRRIAFDYEDHGFRNRVNFKSWVNEIYNMGYNQDRDDLDFEYYNDAEQIISRLNITNTEGGMPVDMETEIKLAKVDRYLRVLQERRALRNQAAEYETIPDFLQLCRRMNSERRKLKDIIRSKPAEDKFDNKLSSVLARDELLEMKAAKQRLLKIRARTDKLKELHASGVATLEGHESMARFKPRTKFGRSEDQKKVDERERGTLLEFDERIAAQLERLSLVSGHAADEGRQSPALGL